MKTLIQYNFELLLALTILFSGLSIAYIIASVKALRQFRLLKVGRRLLLVLVFTPLGLLFSGLLIGVQGLHSLTEEQFIATLNIRPLPNQQFEATFTEIEGTQRRFILKGDQVQIDAHIVKWKPIANLLGLHTHYKLDRISGRYLSVESAQHNGHSAFSLADEAWLDLVDLRLKHHTLEWLMDAEYGSATFITAKHPKSYRLLVSTSGLMIREDKAL